MAHKDQITYRLGGDGAGDDRLELSVFKKKMASFNGLLEACAEDAEEKGVAFRIADISYSSPMAVVCEPIGADSQVCPSIAINFRAHLDAVQRGAVRAVPEKVRGHFVSLARPIPKELEYSEIQIADARGKPIVYSLDHQFRKQLDSPTVSLPARSNEINTIEGKLDNINLREEVNEFRMHTFTHSVQCQFPSDILEKVRSGLGRYVSVSGRCHYRRNSGLAHRIEVHSMKILPLSEDIPSLADLAGCAPNITGDKTPEQFVRELRDEWD